RVEQLHHGTGKGEGQELAVTGKGRGAEAEDVLPADFPGPFPGSHLPNKDRGTRPGYEPPAVRAEDDVGIPLVREQVPDQFATRRLPDLDSEAVDDPGGRPPAVRARGRADGVPMVQGARRAGRVARIEDQAAPADAADRQGTARPVQADSLLPIGRG